SEETEPIRVRIRGYNDHEKKAVYMEGTISPLPKQVWQVEDLIVARVGNDRAFFRLDTNIDATVTTFGGIGAGEKPCKLLNISVGGARISSIDHFHEGDKFLLKVKLLEDRDTSAIFCEVLRVIENGTSKFEYGCRFLELNESDQERITQNIFAVQRQKRGSSLG
ncbi:MAG: PilZ domain-containing protein, partial [Oscillospiraceae bacterium]|nr:PilZ domain-containing protein [Oscillospiraceae bacterium]